MWTQPNKLPLLSTDHTNKQFLVLWPLFHYVVWDKATDGRAEKKFWRNYVAVNQCFADAVIQRYEPGDFSKMLREILVRLCPNEIFFSATH